MYSFYRHVGTSAQFSTVHFSDPGSSDKESSVLGGVFCAQEISVAKSSLGAFLQSLTKSN